MEYISIASPTKSMYASISNVTWCTHRYRYGADTTRIEIVLVTGLAVEHRRRIKCHLNRAVGVVLILHVTVENKTDVDVQPVEPVLTPVRHNSGRIRDRSVLEVIRAAAKVFRKIERWHQADHCEPIGRRAARLQTFDRITSKFCIVCRYIVAFVCCEMKKLRSLMSDERFNRVR
jgi:hypothetical protein